MDHFVTRSQPEGWGDFAARSVENQHTQSIHRRCCGEVDDRGNTLSWPEHRKDARAL
jgi:hypothetical protein